MNFASESDKAINLDDLINEIGESFASSLRNSLAPFVDRVNSIDSSYKAISDTLKKIPEFRDLVSENEELKNELIEFKRSYVEYPSVTLKVTEKERRNEDTNTIVEQLYLDVDLPSYKENNGTTSNTDEINNTDDSSADDSSADDSSADDSSADDSNEDDNDNIEDNVRIELHSVPDENDSNDDVDKPLTARSAFSDVENNDKDTTDSNNGNEIDNNSSNNDDNNDDVNDDINEEVYLIEIHNKGTFYTDDETNGIIYTIEDDDEIGERVGIFNDGIEVFD
jgi:hypothetical protein